MKLHARQENVLFSQQKESECQITRNSSDKSSFNEFANGINHNANGNNSRFPRIDQAARITFGWNLSNHPLKDIFPENRIFMYSSWCQHFQY